MQLAAVQSPVPHLLTLFQLASPSLPVGAYAYSQGLEWAVEARWVHDEHTLADWLADQLRHALAAVDLPVFARLHRAALADDLPAMLRWSRVLIAARETRELVADDNARGRALAILLRDLGIPAAGPWTQRDDTPFAALFAVAAAHWSIPLTDSAWTLAWGWLENQVLAGVKLVPLGQVAGQRLMLRLAPSIPGICADGLARDDDDIGGTLPALALASTLHETQYTRLFRS
jgi:urease accessory protein